MSETIISTPPAGGQQQPASGQQSAWYSGVGPDLESLAQTKGWDSPAKALDSYRNLEKMLGTEKISAPRKDWKPEDWNSFYAKIGRPEAPDKYALPEVKPEEGLTLDEKKVAEVRKLMHETGLTQAQAEKLAGWYFGDLNGTFKAAKEQNLAAKANGEKALRDQWKDRYDSEVDIARRAFSEFADDGAKQFILESGLGDDPRFVALFNKIGREMMEDSATGRGPATFEGGGAALAEIDRLKSDKDFMAALFDARAVGHKESKERWTKLHQSAYPNRPDAATNQ